VGLIFYIFVNFSLNPATYKADTNLIGFNAAKGGYIWRLASVYIVFALSYHFIVFTVKNSFKHLIAFLIFMAYLFFLDRQRTEIVATLFPLLFFMFVRLRWYESINRIIQLLLLVAIVCLIIYYINPLLLQFTADMFITFFKFLLGMDTGEASADSRIIQFTNAYNYFERHPSQVFFGIGYPGAEVLFLEMGKFVFADCGIVGVLVAHGIVGTIFQLAMFLYPTYIFFKVKHYRNDIYYNLGIIGVTITLASGMFSGAFAKNPFGLFYFISFMEYYRVKEKIYWREQRASGATITTTK
jgi:hypothetical protein